MGYGDVKTALCPVEDKSDEETASGFLNSTAFYDLIRRVVHFNDRIIYPCDAVRLACGFV
jgi:hypothetical protein